MSGDDFQPPPPPAEDFIPPPPDQPPPPKLEGASKSGGLDLGGLPPAGDASPLPPVPADTGAPAGLPPIPTNDDAEPEDTEDPTYNLLNYDFDPNDLTTVEQGGKVFHAFAHKNVKSFK